MDEAARLITLLAILGVGLTVVGGALAYVLDEERRVRRTLRQALGADPQPLLVARGRGVGVGFNLAAGLVVVTWDRGGWRLTYRLDELMGLELVVDRQVAARAFRGESRRPLDRLEEPQERVRLRFVFDDPQYVDFEVDLWTPKDEGRRRRLSAHDALHEANRWLARIEALLRRSTAARLKPAVAHAPPPGAPRPARQDAPFEDDSEEL